jgi:hypothetical protein
VRIASNLPTTGTNKVLVRELRRQKYRPDLVGGDELWVRDRGEDRYRRFTDQDAADLLAQLRAAGRERFWEL